MFYDQMFYWSNRFNSVEEGGPFETINGAISDAIAVYQRCQNGFAYDIGIHNLNGEWVANGWMCDGKWIEGDYNRALDTRAIAQ